MSTHSLPILYSFRRCPYAMRARLGLTAAKIKVELREIILRNKPKAMLELSPKGTVPVLWLEDKTVIDESLDIAKWALAKHDPLNLLKASTDTSKMQALISENDGPFKHHLDRTKYANRYLDEPPQDNRAQASAFLQKLNTRLKDNEFLFGNSLSLADITIAPFVRQFANIDRTWFDEQPWPHLIRWLDNFLKSPLFHSVMQKYPAWQEGDEITLFPDRSQIKTPNGLIPDQQGPQSN